MAVGKEKREDLRCGLRGRIDRARCLEVEECVGKGRRCPVSGLDIGKKSFPFFGDLVWPVLGSFPRGWHRIGWGVSRHVQK